MENDFPTLISDPECREDTPSGWAEKQDKLAASLGLSVLLVNGRQPPASVVSNNNSICEALQSSRHANLCEPYCGDAHRRAMLAQDVSNFKCHAGMHCFAMPVQIGKNHKYAAIGGRAFTSSVDYQQTMERLFAGDLNDLFGGKVFQNVIFSDSLKLEQLANRLRKSVDDYSGGDSNVPPSQPTRPDSDRSSVLLRELDLLRSELDYRSRLGESVKHFLERISDAEAGQTYGSILSNSRELLRAERAALLLFEEESQELVLKAAVGMPTHVQVDSRLRLGEGISAQVFETGEPLRTEDVEKLPVLPEEQFWTDSFISYPITIGKRRIGVLNLADRSDGKSFDDLDLSLLEIIGPQVALALERAEWQERAGEFQLMSITDPLTGLPNRRYLHERLSEEVNRSRRYDYVMSFLMIDIDDFKLYNDQNGHQAGDVALQMTAHSLKATLRSADVAARYGGEEFCILLPQTSAAEATVIAERVRQGVLYTAYPHGASQPLGSVSVSIGVSTFSKKIDTAEKVVAAADRALYSAKRKGKNRIDHYDESLVGAS